MVNEIPISEADAYRSPQPMIRTIGWADLKDSLANGLDDFKEMPTHVAFLCVIYPFVMLILARTYAGYDVLPLVFPFLAGYTLIGPLVATGMYELSRRRELGLDTSRGHAFDVFRSPSFRSIVTLGILLLAVYFAWLAVAQAIYGQFFGPAVPESVAGFVAQVISTPAGWSLIVAKGYKHLAHSATALIYLATIRFSLRWETSKRVERLKFPDGLLKSDSK